MPSARRSMSSSSSPSPTTARTFSRRNGPYPPTPTRSQATASLNGTRRCQSSRTETTSRQVLADIDWWRVELGQLEQPTPTTPAGHGGDILMANINTTPSPTPVDDMENIDSGSGNDMASPQYALTAPSTPASSSTPSSRASTPPRGELRRALMGRTSSMGALEMMLHMNRTNTDDNQTMNDHIPYPTTTFDASARRI